MGTETADEKSLQGMEEMMHALARQIAYNMEVKKDGLSQKQDGSWKVTFTVHPQDMNQSLCTDSMGQRYVMALVPIDDNEEPRLSPSASSAMAERPTGEGSLTPRSRSKWEDMSYPQRAGIRSNDPLFWEFADVNNAEGAARYIREYCNVQSRADIKLGTVPGLAFDTLDRDFDTWLKYERQSA